MRLGFSAIDGHPIGDLFFPRPLIESAQTLQLVDHHQRVDHHAALWRYLALAKANDDRSAARGLAEQSARANLDKRWPAAIVEYYPGRSASFLYAAAETAEESNQIEQRCQANFYVAEAKLLKGAKDKAISRLL